MDKQKPTYRFTIKANNRPIKHFVNREDYGFYIPACASNDKEMEDHARGMHITLAGLYKKSSVEVYCLDEIGEYRMIAKFS